MDGPDRRVVLLLPAHLHEFALLEEFPICTRDGPVASGPIYLLRGKSLHDKQ